MIETDLELKDADRSATRPSDRGLRAGGQSILAWGRTRVGDLFRRAPGWRAHALVAVLASILLWGASTPAYNFGIWVLGALAMMALAAIWLLRLVVYIVCRRRGTAVGAAGGFAVAPLLLGVTVLVSTIGIPLQVRWRLSRSAFEDVVATAPAPRFDGDWYSMPGYSQIGSYEIGSVYRVNDGVIFYERTGGFLDDSGFAYFPNGPSPGLHSGSFENPRFTSIGDGWYTWTASW